MKPRTVLIISSSGGGGCLQAALAKEQEENDKNPNVLIVKRDIMKDWYPKIIGKLGVFAWNQGQRTGCVKILECLQKCQPTSEGLFWPFFFYRFLKTAWKMDVDHVIDTQPQGTSAFLLALRIFNRIHKKNVKLEKIVVDLPTEKNTHFFRPIKKLSSQNRKLLQMVTIPPLLKKGQTAADFWRQHCNLPQQEVIYQFVVRRAFSKIQNHQRTDKNFSLTVSFANSEEREFLSKTIRRGSLPADIRQNDAKFFIHPKDKVITILLGSQPSRKATLCYVHRFLNLANESVANAIHLFVFCSYHNMGEKSLLWEVADMVLQMKNYPSHMTVIPLGFQNEDTVARVLFRSDLTCTRSGGQTAMELMCVSKGEFMIHSETKKTSDQSDLSLDQLLKGIPGWEAGSALYLKEMRNAKIVTPDTFIPHARRILQNS